MLQGETGVTLNDTGRLALPTAYRDLIASACANRLVFTYNPFEHGCLWLFPQGEWEKVRDQVNALSSVKRVMSSGTLTSCPRYRSHLATSASATSSIMS